MKSLIRMILILQLGWLNACTQAKRLDPKNEVPQSEQNDIYSTYELPKGSEASETSEAVESAPIHQYMPSVRKGGAPMGKKISMERLNSFGANAGIAAEMEGGEDFDGAFNTESYDTIAENTFHNAIRDPLSTFSIDVDTASYANIRRMIQSHQKPIKDAVRVEEMINYFDYQDPAPQGTEPFAVNMESATAPWNTKHHVVRIGIKGREIKADKRPASNLVFLIDTSGSMMDQNKLPLVQQSMRLLVNQLGAQDRISIVVYAGSAGQVLAPTSGTQKTKILDAIDRLYAGGSTNGGQGIQLAYKLAEQNFIKGGVNRVILASDGDFNVGVTDRSSLVEMATQKASKNIYLSVLGYGMGNIKDGMMEELSRKANGNYAYIDSLNEAKKVLVEQMSGTLVTIAKDVKIQVEFNPKLVEAYRLVGYENRMLKNEDFNDDKKDAGEIGAGHTVTALYEIVPKGEKVDTSTVDPLKYQKTTADAAFTGESSEWMNVKIRYKKPDGDVSAKIEKPFSISKTELAKASEALRFSSSVAMFGMWLRGSQFLKEGNLKTIQSLATNSIGSDPSGYRAEFIQLVSATSSL